MKKTITAILISILVLFVYETTFAQEDGGDFSFEDFSGEAEAESGGLTWNGEVSLKTRYMLDYEDLKNSSVYVYPELDLGLVYEGAHSELIADLKFSQDSSFDELNKFITEAYFRLYYDTFDLEAGYMKVTWGKGDELKGVDVLNPIDYSDFINQTLLERKMSEKMIKLNISLGMDGLLELVYIPVFTPDVYAMQEPWVPRQIEDILALLSTPELPYPDTNTLDYGQYALRYTNTFGGFDLGALYYYGFIKEPSFEIIMTPSLSVDISFDRVHVFGLETAAVLAGFSTRTEFGYYLTEDTTGDDPLVHNNNLAYLLGFDRDLPISNLNILIESLGSYILKNDEITTTEDIEYDSDDEYTTHIVLLKISDSYNHEKIKPQVTFAYNIEKQDYIIRPEIEFTLRDDIRVSVAASFFQGEDDTYFGQFDDNDFAEILFEYAF